LFDYSCGILWYTDKYNKWNWILELILEKEVVALGFINMDSNISAAFYGVFYSSSKAKKDKADDYYENKKKKGAVGIDKRNN